MTTMAEEIRMKRAFHEDIFAEDPDKWSWPAMGSNSKATSSGVNYTSEVKSDSSCSSGSENGFVFRGDSDSLKKNLNKRGSSSTSDVNIQEDVSSSSHPSVGLPRERLLPSIYDDDAQSGSPSGIFEKKDLAFRSSFKKSFTSSSRDKSGENSPFHTAGNDSAKLAASVREHSVENQNSGLSPGRRDSIDARSKKSFSDVLPKRSRSKSREMNFRRRSRTRSHSRSRDKRTRSPRRERRRSRSRDRRSEKERSKHPRSRRSRSKESRRRSRSRSHDKHRRRGHYRSSSRDRYRRRRYSRSRSRSKGGSGGRKPGSLPLSTSGGAMTPQMALQQTMAAMSAKAQALTGIALPKYYNPAAVNPLKYAEQVQKRKLLWQTKEKVEEQQQQQQPKNSVWDKLTFAQDQDGKMTAKFRKLMGIKSEENGLTEAEEKESVLKKQEELFRNLDQQYEMARMTTHTQRGVGLGYSAQPLYPPVQK